MTLGDLQGHSSVASLYIGNFSYCCAAVDKISTDVASDVNKATRHKAKAKATSWF